MKRYKQVNELTYSSVMSAVIEFSTKHNSGTKEGLRNHELHWWQWQGVRDFREEVTEELMLALILQG